jgi:plastocyanin
MKDTTKRLAAPVAIAALGLGVALPTASAAFAAGGTANSTRAARHDDDHRHHGPRSVSVAITGSDNFVRPGLITNDYSFPRSPIVVRQGGTITFHNLTDEGHTIALVGAADVPASTAQVDHCGVCDAVNGVFGLNGPGNPTGAQLDGGKVSDDDSQADADAPDLGAIKSAKGPLPPQSAFPILIEDFDTPSHGTTVGDATIVDTTDPTNGHGFPTQRTIVLTAKPGLYHYICTLHPWMQGEIRVTR